LPLAVPPVLPASLESSSPHAEKANAETMTTVESSEGAEKRARGSENELPIMHG
jgi:hypothetical protein